MRYVYYELPLETIKKLEQLYTIKNIKDLQKKYDEAAELFKKVMSEINLKAIEQQIQTLTHRTAGCPNV
jgi:ferritin